ncbi:MAG: NADH-quinone oxidoreductase subunit L [Campylobacter sp.]|nr:NADH-quinone oxidoreductase subunit L [Campylobacter sp.]
MNFYICVAFFAPLVSFAIALAFSFCKKSYLIGGICSFLMVVSTICSFILLEITSKAGAFTYELGSFINVGFLSVKYSLIIDELSTIMMCVVGIVASVVHMYSIGYMANDEKFNKFFAFLGLFVFAMLLLVMSDNLVGLFIGWEGVGLCSWLLIGFWYDKKNFSWCANEAFIMNRIADLAMLVGIFMVYAYVGSFKYSDIFVFISSIDDKIVFFMAVAFLIGAMGKSAQFPFHTWLADAMAGPTPVSALIHAATMVTAGVYLIVRIYPVFVFAPEVSEFIVILGAFMGVFAASMALVHDDLKKIIAYSTLSQLGYMFVAAGFGAYHLAIFHLVTHAFFKSLLFLCAGNIMHAMNDDTNIKHMGGLYRFLKPTAILMGIGSLALCGLYPFAGFFSKDKILEVAFFSGDYAIWLALLVGAIFTAFYSFRLIMLVFFVKPKFTHHPHEAKLFMLVALIPLAILAIISGFSYDKFYSFIAKFVPRFDFELSHFTHISLIALTLIVVILSIIFAIFAYKKEIFSEKCENIFIYKLLKNEYFIPHFYKNYVIATYEKISNLAAKFDMKIIDKIVDGIAKLMLVLGQIPVAMQNGGLSVMIRFMVLGFMLLMIFVVIF